MAFTKLVYSKRNVPFNRYWCLKTNSQDTQQKATFKEKKRRSNQIANLAHSIFGLDRMDCLSSLIRKETTPKFIHEMTHWSTEKNDKLRKTILFVPFHKTASKIYQHCPIYPKHNSGKPIRSPVGHFPLPLGRFEVCQSDFIQLPPSQGCKYGLVMICMYAHWVEAFPCHRATVSAIAKLLSGNITPNERIPSEWHSNWQTH